MKPLNSKKFSNSLDLVLKKIKNNLAPKRNWFEIFNTQSQKKTCTCRCLLILMKLTKEKSNIVNYATPSSMYILNFVISFICWTEIVRIPIQSFCRFVCLFVEHFDGHRIIVVGLLSCVCLCAMYTKQFKYWCSVGFSPSVKSNRLFYIK